MKSIPARYHMTPEKAERRKRREDAERKYALKRAVARAREAKRRVAC